ncbi:MAG: hypothetical protein L0H93_08700, partial [Nocardioides sp.]|nr:hypothetical protein [Nocardioides sp.]
FSLPAQDQGEGVAVAPDDRIYLSSEGVQSELLRVQLPLDIRQKLDPADAPEEGAGHESDASDAQVEPERDPWPWIIGGMVGVVAIGVLIRSLKPH